MNALTRLSQAEKLLAEASTLDDLPSLQDLRDYAEAARIYAERSRMSTCSINYATRIKIDAERKQAEIVTAGQAIGQIAVRQNGDSLKSGVRTLSDLGIDKRRLSEARKLLEYSEEEIDDVFAQANAEGREVSRSALVRKRPHVSHNSGENEWYTPAPIIEAARKCMGGIDLDPATSEVANRVVMADVFYTASDDGLTKHWRASSLWMNPPYAQPLISQFVEKLCTHVEAGDVERAIVLVNNGTETKWGQRLLGLAGEVCFPSGRIRFVDREGNPGGAPLQGQMIVSLGSIPGFCAAFSSIGVVL